MAKLHIVRASAGSGKTFRLTLQYLSGLFTDSESFRHILAVTFTNKAAEEMKSRIIKVLHDLSAGEKSDYLEHLKELTNLEEKAIRSKAAVIIKKILHQYSYFSVCTIDSFFQQVIRSFTREMGIQSGFTVELDENLILVKAIDDLLDRVDEEDELRSWILRFAESRMEASKSWNLKNEIKKLGEELFKERFKESLEIIRSKLTDKSYLKEYIGELNKITNVFEKTLIEYGRHGIELIEKNGYLISDFYQKERGPAGYLKKLSEGVIQVHNNFVENTLQDPEKWVSAGTKDKHAILSFCEKILHPHLIKTVEYYRQFALRYNTAKAILANIYSLGILMDIASVIREQVKERSLFLISDSAEFINRIIDNNDTPFIYEKTGNYFQRFLIDEFQDTSGFQWKNFKPLISNSLSQNFDCLLVGDVKQSIYRFRNSNWEILADGIFKDFYRDAIKLETLNTNRRSLKDLVSFFNHLFPVLAEIAGNLSEMDNPFFNGNEIIKNLFADVRQNSPGNIPKGGYVKIKFLDSKNGDLSDIVMANLIESIKQLQDNGYTPGEIAVLTRGRNEGKLIADYIINYRQSQESGSKYRFDVISDESLFLGSSMSVRFIVALLKYLISPDDDINNYYILTEYLGYFKDGKEISQVKLPEYDRENREAIMKSVLPEEFSVLVQSKQNFSLFELVREIIHLFGLNSIKGEIAYLMAFKDTVREYIKQNSANITSFLEYWEEKGKLKSVPASDSQDAIRILTIHKSKGLEFEAVVVPFCNWKFEHPGNVLWCKSTEEPFSKLEILPVIYKKSLADTYFAKDYFTEKLKIIVDNLNLLYVAFTRARSALICFSELSEGNGALTGISQLMGSAFSAATPTDDGFLGENYNREKNEFETGRITKPSGGKETITKSKEITEILEYDTLKRMRVVYRGIDYIQPENIEQQPVNYGKLMHELFSQVKTAADIEMAVEKMIQQGKITSMDKGRLLNEVSSLLGDLQVNSWFSGNWTPVNERDILQRGKEIKRPDRVLVKDDKALVIDYKFGEKELKEHRKQVLEYGRLMGEMGYKQVDCYLWYITKRKVVQVLE